MRNEVDLAYGEDWRSMETAPKDGSRILGKQGASESLIFWSESYGWCFADILDFDGTMCGSLHPFSVWKPSP